LPTSVPRAQESARLITAKATARGHVWTRLICTLLPFFTWAWGKIEVVLGLITRLAVGLASLLLPCFRIELGAVQCRRLSWCGLVWVLTCVLPIDLRAANRVPMQGSTRCRSKAGRRLKGARHGLCVVRLEALIMAFQLWLVRNLKLTCCD
jgi:hypothetical protein